MTVGQRSTKDGRSCHRQCDPHGSNGCARRSDLRAAADAAGPDAAIAPGDYDGDGLVDYAVWRPSAMPQQSKFVIRLSSNPNIEWTVAGGIGTDPADYPVAASRVK